METLKNTNDVSNHSIALSRPLRYAPQRLLVDPYVLGSWLGDGAARSATFYTNVDDMDEQIEEFGRRGYEVTKVTNGQGYTGNGRAFRVGSNLQSVLRNMGLLKNKHVPTEYLMASVEQRQELLAGMLDTDGHIDDFGRVEFCNTNRNLIEGVAELVRSLGMIPTVTTRRLEGTDGRGMGRSLTWAVRFTPTTSCFNLRRKDEKIKGERARNLHYVVAAEKLDNGRTVCIEVDSPSHKFLAGEAMVPTHNSVLRSAFKAWYYKRRIEEFEAVGVERDLAGLPMGYVPAEWMGKDATANEKMSLQAMERIVRGVKRNETEGIVLPMMFDENGKQLVDFKLLSSGGTRQFNTDAIISRYNQQIAMTCLADFIMLGHEAVGSFALGASKVDLFMAAVESWVRLIAEVFNSHAIPRLMALNGFDGAHLPTLTYGQVTQVDLVELGTFITNLFNAQLLTPDNNLEDYLRDLMGVPPFQPEEDGMAENQRYGGNQIQPEQTMSEDSKPFIGASGSFTTVSTPNSKTNSGGPHPNPGPKVNQSGGSQNQANISSKGYPGQSGNVNGPMASNQGTTS